MSVCNHTLLPSLLTERGSESKLLKFYLQQLLSELDSNLLSAAAKSRVNYRTFL